MKYSTRHLGLLLAPLAFALATAATRDGVNTTVSGVVHDSIARRPLSGALVQLVADDSAAIFGQTVVSDSLGHFQFPDVPRGHYLLGFFHPMLDSLGLEPMLRAVAVTGEPTVRADLAIPSAAKLRTAICGPPSNPNSGAVVVGVVRNAHDLEPAAGVTVTGEWAELVVGKGLLQRRIPRRTMVTQANGWFALCGVPSPGTTTLMATRGADSTAAIEVDVSADGFLRRELWLGRLDPREGTLTGTVSSANGRKPLGGAQVGIAGGPQTRTNERGEWTLSALPTGTRMLDVRAVGHYSERRAVDVVTGAVPVVVALATLKSVLDTMKVTASRLVNLNLVGFHERRKSGLGRFVTPADIARRQPITTSELFRAIPGVYIEIVKDADTLSFFSDRSEAATDTLGIRRDMKIVMRGTFSERCIPAVYVNGTLAFDLAAADLDALMRPTDIAGIEIYSATQTPAQFQPGMTRCGSIVFWTK